jgi:osmotically-inducible protein OsmY
MDHRQGEVHALVVEWCSGSSVTTEDAVVALSGQVDSEAERKPAVELAQELRGVQSVDAAGLTF